MVTTLCIVSGMNSFLSFNFWLDRLLRTSHHLFICRFTILSTHQSLTPRVKPFCFTNSSNFRLYAFLRTTKDSDPVVCAKRFLTLCPWFFVIFLDCGFMRQFLHHIKHLLSCRHQLRNSCQIPRFRTKPLLWFFGYLCERLVYRPICVHSVFLCIM